VSAHEELDKLYKTASIAISIQLLSNGGFEVKTGDYLHDNYLRGHAENFEEAVELLKMFVESHQHQGRPHPSE
jgi:hypothetical protein